MSKYSIRYGNGHGARSINTSAESKSEAKSKVRSEAGNAYGNEGADSVVFVSTDDGIYGYLTQEDADNDETGANAFAVIDQGEEI